MTDSANRTPNRLIREKSPYLLQHAYNPVDWYPWCEEAFETAKRENKMVFLSIGYSSCHWCHVMEEESFENEKVARLLNESFVAVKVDKEERPDIDAVYMSVCQAFTGQGGWPTTVLTTPEQKPFFAGTYFPPGRRQNQPGLLDILTAAKETWDNQPEKLEATGEQVVRLLNARNGGAEQVKHGEWEKMGQLLLEKASAHYRNSFDPVWGGFGAAPKFPAAHNLLFLMGLHEGQGLAPAAEEGLPYENSTELEMVEKTLQQMYAGGIYDHVGFGFCRYSTDERWLVPHFEKMLYDNALLCMAYTECWRITKRPFYRRVAEEILEYVSREMRSSEGGFYSAQDADSEGVEGKYYVFTPEEVKQVLGEEQGAQFCQLFGITEGGNFEGKSIPNLLDTLRDAPEKIPGLEDNSQWCADASVKHSRARRELNERKRKLCEYRKKRMSLHTDDKVLTSWNSLMIAAFARAYQVFGRREYLEHAQEAERFLKERLMKKDGSLQIRYRDGESAGDGFLDDYAFYEWALLELLKASHRAAYLQRAMEIQEKMTDEFLDKDTGGFYFIGEKQEQLILRPKETYDGAIPSGNSVAAWNMVLLKQKLGSNEQRQTLAEEQLSFLAAALGSHPASGSFGMTALLEWLKTEKPRTTGAVGS